MTKVVMSFTLDSQNDRQILQYLQALPKGERSQAIRNALDAQIGGEPTTLGDVYQAVKDLERKLASGPVLVQAGSPGISPHEPEDEPADVAANLDGLGL
jgi:hypothetical protein